MSDVKDALDLVKELDARRADRRKLLARAGLVGAAAVGASLLGGRSGGIAQAAEVALFKSVSGGKGFRVNDYDILNFALNLEYLEAAYFQMAALGHNIGPDFGGTAASVTGGHQIAFTDPVVNRLADESAEAEYNHITVLRSALGARAVPIPNINLNAFTAAAAAANIPGTFDAFANDIAFLLAAFTFEDVGVTAYNGAAPFISSPKLLAAASSILAVEAYHAGAARLRLYSAAYLTDTDVISAANDISNLRQTVSAVADPTNPDTETPLTSTTGVAFFASTNGEGLAFHRTFPQVLNIVYLNTTASPKPGGFFPDGLNGRIR